MIIASGCVALNTWILSFAGSSVQEPDLSELSQKIEELNRQVNGGTDLSMVIGVMLLLGIAGFAAFLYHRQYKLLGFQQFLQTQLSEIELHDKALKEIKQESSENSRVLQEIKESLQDFKQSEGDSSKANSNKELLESLQKIEAELAGLREFLTGSGKAAKKESSGFSLTGPLASNISTDEKQEESESSVSQSDNRGAGNSEEATGTDNFLESEESNNETGLAYNSGSLESEGAKPEVEPSNGFASLNEGAGFGLKKGSKDTGNAENVKGDDPLDDAAESEEAEQKANADEQDVEEAPAAIFDEISTPEYYENLSDDEKTEALQIKHAVALIHQATETNQASFVMEANRILNSLRENDSPYSGLAAQVHAEGLLAIADINRKPLLFTRAISCFKKVSSAGGIDEGRLYEKWAECLLKTGLVTGKVVYTEQAVNLLDENKEEKVEKSVMKLIAEYLVNGGDPKEYPVVEQIMEKFDGKSIQRTLQVWGAYEALEGLLTELKDKTKVQEPG